MRKDFLDQVLNPSHLELDGLVGSIRPDGSTSSSFFDHVKEFCSVLVLADREARSHLPAESMPSARLKGHAEATFAINETRDVGWEVHRQVPGPACYGIRDSRCHPGASSPESLRGSPCDDLTLGITRDVLQRREGSTDLSRCLDGIAPAPGSCVYPTRNFAQSCYVSLRRVSRFCSAHLCVSPRSSDHIILRLGFPEVRRMASEDSECGHSVFPAGCLHRMDCHSLLSTTGFSRCSSI